MVRSRLFSTPLACLVAIVLAGCSTAGGQAAFNATFPPISSPPVATAAISLIDQTGLVTGMTIVAATPATTGMAADPNDPNSVRATWLGTDCDGRTSLVLADTGAGYNLVMHVNPGVAGGLGCQSVEIMRAVTIQFRQPIDPARITISQQYP